MNEARANEGLTTTIQQFEEWDDARGISEHSNAAAQFEKLFEEVIELGRNIHAGKSTPWYKRKLQNEIVRLYANNKMAVHLDGAQAGVIDGIGDSLKCLQSVSSLSGVSIGTCAAHAYDEIKDRKGALDRHGVWQKE